MSTTKQNKSVLAADQNGKGTTSAVSTTGTKSAVRYGSDSWTYPDEQIVRDVLGERMTFGELKKRKAEGYYDTHRVGQSSGTAGSRKSSKSSEESSQSSSGRTAAKTSQQTYQSLLDEVYADYRRSQLLFPEVSASMESGGFDSLFDQNDRAFQQFVEEEAQQQSRKNQKLLRHLEALTGDYHIPAGF